jgi:hypothetical protein
MKITPVCLLLLMYTLAKSQTEIPSIVEQFPMLKKLQITNGQKKQIMVYGHP